MNRGEPAKLAQEPEAVPLYEISGDVMALSHDTPMGQRAWIRPRWI